MKRITCQQLILLVLVLTSLNIDFIDANCFAECSKNALCKNYGEEFCCECISGFIGNGVNCVQKDEQISLRGKITGSINKIKLDEQDAHAFVQTLASDARNYVAIGQVPRQLGNKLTLLLPFATPIHWIFAGSSSNALNGFSLTGGVFSRQSDSTFFNEQGDIIGNLYINQNFTGLTDGQRELSFETFIDASLPDLADDEQVIYPDYDEKYEYKSNVENPSTRKLVETRSSIKYLVASRYNTTRLRNFRIEHNERIHFSVCKSANEEKLSENSASVLLMTKRLTVSYTQSDSQLKFMSANFIRALNSIEPNPCASHDCSVFAECVVESETDRGYYCQCKPGFIEEDNECKDVNECEEPYCSEQAECVNFLGYHECKCRPPLVGDGRVCELETDRNQDDVCARCDPNASCHLDSYSNRYCACNSGYSGNGFQCQQEGDNSDESNRIPPTQSIATSTRARLEHNDRCDECHEDARCDSQPGGGECCACLEGYIGNGKYCIKETTPIKVTGKVAGTLNNQRLDDLDLHAYVLTHTSDSRNFVAIGKIPSSLGGSFQVLINLVSPINWLFSGRNGIDKNIKVYNGFALTGGLFNRVSTVNFYDEAARQSSSVIIRQEYLGVDSQSKDLVVQTEIDGNIPNIDPDSQVIFKDFKQEYTRYAKGLIRSSGEITYEITSVRNSQASKAYRIDYSDEFTFSECPHWSELGSDTHRVNSKHVFVRFTKGDSLVRFSSANYIYPSDMADDPCELNTCSIYAECVADSEMPSNYSCVCKVGFEGDGFSCYDIDECENGESNCDINAACYNYVGHHECSCKAPYIGNGIECTYDLGCSSCHANAECVDYDSQKKCTCRPGYYGDGFNCQLDTSDCQCSDNAECLPNYETARQECKCKQGFHGDGLTCNPLPCNEYSNCNENAKCVLNEQGMYECQCLKGYIGDGYQCSTKSCDILNNCGENAECIADSTTLQYRCQCSLGYSGNGYRCTKNAKTCDELKNCHQFAECLFDEKLNHHTCKCKSSFSGDGYYCSPINSCKYNDPNACDSNADCVYDSRLKDHVCKCKPGFEGNGLKSNCFFDDSYGLYLVYAQGASLHKIVLKATNEQTNEALSSSSPHMNRIVHVPGQTSVAVAYDCHEQYIYWSDVSSNVINRIRPDGSNYSIVLQNVKSAEGLSIDWLSRNLYFTDSETRTIEVVSLNGQFRKTLIRTHLSNPRGIAVDPIDGYIFWTDWNRKNPKIERSNMDGTHRKVLVNTDIGVPNGLYFDQKRQEVCWGDAKTNRIECVEKDGSNRRVVVKINQMYPFDLTEVRTNIYWSDWSRKEIQNVDKSGVINTPIKLSIGGSGRVYGVVAVKNMCPRGTNACDRNNGGCSQLCLPKPDFNRQCACSDDANYECTKALSP